MLEALLEYAQASERVCPVPDKWHELWKMLPDRRREGSGWEPPLPLILSGCWHSSNLDKRLRLQQHLRWADEHGALPQIDAFLRALAEFEWHHVKD